MPGQPFRLALLLIITIELVSCDFAERQNLYRNLMAAYDKNLCPENGNPVDTKIGLSITSFNNNYYRQLGVNVFLQMEWNDFRLSWDDAMYNVTELRIKSEFLWIPDIAQYDGMKNPIINFPKITTLVKSDGSVSAVFPVTLTVSCDVTGGGFLFYYYSCPITLGSWAYSSSYVNVTSKAKNVNIKDFQDSSSKYDLTSTSTKEKTTYYTCCPEPYRTIEYKLYLQEPVTA